MSALAGGRSIPTPDLTLGPAPGHAPGHALGPVRPRRAPAPSPTPRSRSHSTSDRGEPHFSIVFLHKLFSRNFYAQELPRVFLWIENVSMEHDENSATGTSVYVNLEFGFYLFQSWQGFFLLEYDELVKTGRHGASLINS